MSFSNTLRELAEPIFTAIRNHPFVQDIAAERLSRDAILHYVQQDTQYLNTYVKVYGLGIAKAETREQMQLFHQRIDLVLHGELIPHENLCRVAGIEHADFIKHDLPLSPTAHHYAKHMLSAAQFGTLGEIVAAVLPCHWTYVDLARYIAKEIEIEQHRHHLFYDWITFYASHEMQQGLEELITLLDQCAESASFKEKEQMKAIFIDGCQLETRFFTMAYTQETW